MLITTENAEQLLYKMAVARKEGDSHIAIPANQTFLNPESAQFGFERGELNKLGNMVVLPLEPVMQAVQDYLYRPAGEQGTLHLDVDGMLRREETRMEINLELLQERFRQLGLPDYMPPGMDRVLEMDPAAVSMRAVLPIEGEPVKLFFFIEQDNDRNFRIRNYEMHVLHSLDIPPKIKGGIDVQALDERMKEVEWIRQGSEPWYRHLRIPDDHPDASTYPAAKAISDVFSLAQHGPDAESIAEKLQMKHWYMLGLHDLIPRINQLEEKHLVKETVLLGKEVDPTIQQTYAAIMAQVAKNQQEQQVATIEQKMQAITWVPNQLDEFLNPEYGGEHKQRDRERWEQIHTVRTQLGELAATGPAGQEKVINLMQAYWQKSELSELVDPLRIYIPNTAAPSEIKQTLELLNHYNLALPDNAELNARTLHMAAMGYYVAVTQYQEIVPAQHIERYLVLEHENPRGMIYEMGHRLTHVSDTADYERARKIFADTVERNNDRQVSHFLIGQFKGEQLKFDYEGYPAKNTGMILHNDAYKKVPGNVEGVEYISINPYAKMELGIPVVLKVDLKNNHVQLYDFDFKPLRYTTLLERRQSENIQQLNAIQQNTERSALTETTKEQQKANSKQNRRRRGRGI